MRPVARVRGSSGSRSAAGLGDARAAALRGRFEQLMQGSGQGLPSVAAALSDDGAPSPPAGRGEKRDALFAQAQAMPWAAAAAALATSRNFEAAPPADMLHGMPVRSGSTADASTARHADKLPTAGVTSEAAAAPKAAVLRASMLPSQAAPSLDALLPDRATQASTARAPDSAEPVAAVPLPQVAPASPADVQAQPPHSRPQARDGEQRSLPELLRDLVQAVVHMSRGREGQWRLTMALKPQVLEGTVVALAAQPGQLNVRFDCAGADVCARLAAVQHDLRLRLAEALSSARPVDVRVDVHAPTTERVHGLV